MKKNHILAGTRPGVFVVVLAASVLFGLFNLRSAYGQVRIAMYGDQGAGERARDVIDLVRRESADLIVVLGDFAYGQKTPAEWLGQYDDILGNDFPVLGVLGNHEEDRWAQYRTLFLERLQRTPELTCDGDYGVKASCQFRGVTILAVAPAISTTPGIDGNDNYEDFIRDALAGDDADFSICAWHKNMREMQVGGKSDEVGWGVYEACREGGGFVATGHEHSYSRTHLMSNFQDLVVASTDNTLELSQGESFAVVSGLGGVGIRDQERTGDWWASIYTSTQAAKHGALFCDFGVNGDTKRASCYFKNTSNEVIDQFDLISNVGENPDGSGTAIRRISSNEDDVEERVATGSMYPNSSDLELTQDASRGTQTIGLRFDNLMVPYDVEITEAYLQFTADEASQGPTTLNIRGQASDDAEPFSDENFDVSSRTQTTAVVTWPAIPAWEEEKISQSPDISEVIQEIVDRPGWQSASALALIVDGTGDRVAESHDGKEDAAPLLTVKYQSNSSNPTPELSIADIDVDETDGIARIDVNAVPPPQEEISVWVATAPGTAGKGADFYGNSKQLIFNPGDTRKSMEVTIVDDTEVENLERFTARIFNPVNARMTRSVASVSITDDDVNARSLSVGDVTVPEEAGIATVTVTLAPAATNTVEVEIATSPETAINGQDFYGTHSTLIFAPGETTKTVSVTIIDDTDTEPQPEFLNVRLFAPVAARLIDPVAKIIIVDND